MLRYEYKLIVNMSATQALDNAINQLHLIFPNLALPRPTRTPAPLADSLAVSLATFSASASPYQSQIQSTGSAHSIPCASSSTNRNTSTNAHSSKTTQKRTACSKRRNASMNNSPLEFYARKIRRSLMHRNRREIWWMMCGVGSRRRVIHMRSTFSTLIDIVLPGLLRVWMDGNGGLLWVWVDDKTTKIVTIYRDLHIFNINTSMCSLNPIFGNTVPIGISLPF